MGNQPSTAETQTYVSSTARTTLFARTGNVPSDVPTQGTATNVPVVEVLLMAPKSVYSRSLEVTTPLQHEGWLWLPTKHNLLVKYPNIPRYIQHGADTGIPKIAQTYIPLNNPSTYALPITFKEIITWEFDKGRYSGPFSRVEVEERISPFQTSPLSMVPKAGKPGKFRLIQNLSLPRNNPVIHSINHVLDSDTFPCTWGTFSTICTLLNNLPLGSQGACRDVAEAYCIIPLAPDQWPGMVIRLSGPDEFGISKCNSFGAATAGGLTNLIYKMHRLTFSEQAVYLAFLLTHWLTSSEQKALAPQASGSMTKPSSTSPKSTWKSTTDRGLLSKKSSERLVSCSPRLLG